MKKKIFMMTLAACLIVLSIVGTSLAYFTDTDAKTNVFTAGNVDIELTYDETDTRLYPGQTYEKVATIENVGTENAYVGLIIEVVTNGSSTFNLETIQNVFTVDGTAYIEEVNELVDEIIPEGDYDTLGGFIISQLGFLPKDGEMNEVIFENLKFTVLNVEERRIGKVRVEITPTEVTEPEE